MARVMTSGSVSRAGRPGFFLRTEEGWRSCHQSSTSTYNETRKESRSIMRHRLWEKVRYQHKVSAPSAFPTITHQSSESSRVAQNSIEGWVNAQRITHRVAQRRATADPTARRREYTCVQVCRHDGDWLAAPSRILLYTTVLYKRRSWYILGGAHFGVFMVERVSRGLVVACGD